ncbi:hypothetical protein RRG08_062927 [Elysia crispata]|nr:hypothetical protein RRG08_062927 [Elysia crispata]
MAENYALTREMDDDQACGIVLRALIRSYPEPLKALVVAAAWTTPERKRKEETTATAKAEDGIVTTPSNARNGVRRYMYVSVVRHVECVDHLVKTEHIDVNGCSDRMWRRVLVRRPEPVSRRIQLIRATHNGLRRLLQRYGSGQNCDYDYHPVVSCAAVQADPKNIYSFVGDVVGDVGG